MNKLTVMGMAAAGTVLVGMGGAIMYKLKHVAQKLNVGVSELTDISKEQIKESLVEAAVKECADQQVSRMLHNLKSDILNEASGRLRAEAHKAVQDAKDEIGAKVEDKLADEIALIDMDDLKKSARKKAEEKILSKFNGNLDDLLSKFNDNLGNVQRIYSGIADAINKTNKSTKEIKFSLD